MHRPCRENAIGRDADVGTFGARRIGKRLALVGEARGEWIHPNFASEPLDPNDADVLRVRVGDALVGVDAHGRAATHAAKRKFGFEEPAPALGARFDERQDRWNGAS